MRQENDEVLILLDVNPIARVFKGFKVGFI